MDYEKMWKEMKELYLQAKKEMEENGWESGIGWQIASYTLESMNKIENKNNSL